MNLTQRWAFGLGVLPIALPVAPPILAQSRARLPIAEGFWVQTDKSCGAAQETYVYKGNRFGSISSLQGVRPSLGSVDRVETNSQGFVRYSSAIRRQIVTYTPSGLEIAARPGGEAIMRESSLASGEVFWSHRFRRCAPESLPVGIRSHAQRLGLLQSAGASGRGAIPARADAPSSNPHAVTVNLRFSPGAKAAMANRTITLRARYLGEPLSARRAQAEAAHLVGEDDFLMVGHAERKVPASDGLITLTPANFSRQHASWIKTLLISIDALGQPPSVRCDAFLERPLAAAQARPVTISCR